MMQYKLLHLCPAFSKRQILRFSHDLCSVWNWDNNCKCGVGPCLSSCPSDPNTNKEKIDLPRHPALISTFNWKCTNNFTHNCIIITFRNIVSILVDALMPCYATPSFHMVHRYDQADGPSPTNSWHGRLADRGLVSRIAWRAWSTNGCCCWVLKISLLTDFGFVVRLIWNSIETILSEYFRHGHGCDDRTIRFQAGPVHSQHQQNFEYLSCSEPAVWWDHWIQREDYIGVISHCDPLAWPVDKGGCRVICGHGLMEWS